MRKAILKLTADTLQKLGIVGLGLSMFQHRSDDAWLALLFLGLSYIITIWES